MTTIKLLVYKGTLVNQSGNYYLGQNMTLAEEHSNCSMSFQQYHNQVQSSPDCRPFQHVLYLQLNVLDRCPTELLKPSNLTLRRYHMPSVFWGFVDPRSEAAMLRMKHSPEF